MHALRLSCDSVADVLIKDFLVVVTLLKRLTHFKVYTFLLLEVITGSILDQTVKVDGHHRLRSGGYGSGTHGILVSVVIVLFVRIVEVLQGIAQTAAAGEAVGTVGQIAEETVSLAPHLCGEIRIILVGEIVASVGKQGHGLDREGEDVFVALFIEPVHKVLLEPVESLPFGRSAVRETEVAEHALEVRLVEVADIPEHGLVAAVAGRHVHGVDDLLEAVVDNLGEGTLLCIVLHHLVETGQVVIAIVLADEIIEIDEELGSRHRSHEL